MTGHKSPSRILVYQAAGFAAIFAISWLNEFLGLPERYLGVGPQYHEWAEGAVEAAAILLIAIPILLLTRRLVSRLFYLERFLKVCAWCRKINDDKRWLSIEDYMSSEFRMTTSHGMCPDCFEKAKRG
ncbi:MAG: hypothetical protein ACM31I_03155 [Deltaproteobacteria bacterium]